MNIEREVAAMRQMTVPQLRLKYAEVAGEETRVRHKEYLIKRIAWRMQANAEGGLAERVRKRALEIANDADLRLTAPREKPPAVLPPVPVPTGDRLPVPGTDLVRLYKGQQVRVTVRSAGFEYQGKLYKSLSAVAKAITGKHWNGYHFFGLQRGDA